LLAGFGGAGSDGQWRTLYVGTRSSVIYYVDYSTVDASSFTRLVLMATPKIPPAKKPDAKATDTCINALPPCSERKFPCRK
jgi:hypothetical protein